MDSIFKQNIKDTFIPPIDDKDLWEFLSIHDFNNVVKVPIIPKPLCKINDCHNNVIKFVEKYGGNRVIGYYILKDIKENNYVGITHSIWDSTKYGLIDITPTIHNYEYNLFIPTNKKELDISRFEYFDNHLNYEYYHMQSNP